MLNETENLGDSQPQEVLPSTRPSTITNNRSLVLHQDSDKSLLQRMQPCAPKTKLHAQSYRCLRQEQSKAAANPKKRYSSSTVREIMKTKTQAHCNGKTPKWYQLDSGEAFLLGMDVVLVSATGSGKTLAFLQSLLADTTKKSKLIIMLPLNELQYDMVCLKYLPTYPNTRVC
jgi:superfamily II helicase